MSVLHNDGLKACANTFMDYNRGSQHKVVPSVRGRHLITQRGQGIALQGQQRHAHELCRHTHKYMFHIGNPTVSSTDKAARF